jgi:sugar lactone lactonase YvrE
MRIVLRERGTDLVFVESCELSSRRMRYRWLTWLGTLTASLIAAVTFFAVPATAATKYAQINELSETPSGRFENPFAVAVNQTFGEIYVVEKARRVVDRFEASGSFTSELTEAPLSAPISGPFGGPEGVAVNASGDVFVVDAGSDVVDEFDSAGTFVRQISGPSVSEPFGALNGSVAVDQSSGSLYVGDSAGNVVDEFDASGSFVRQLTSTPPSAPVSGPLGSVRGLAVDALGDLYVADQEGKVVDEFDSTGGFVRQLSGAPADAPIGGAFLNPRAVAVDQSSGDLYVADNEEKVIDEFDASGVFLAQLQLAEANPVGLAVDGLGNLYVADNESGTVKVFAPEIVPDVSTSSVSEVGETTATLIGQVNPDGLPVASCEFEYGTEIPYGQSVPCEQTPIQIGEGSKTVPVSANLTGLNPRTVYHFRLVVANANGPNQGEDRRFTTPEHPTIDNETVSDVTSTAATLSAGINPGGLSTSYQFEYGTSEAYGEKLPVSPGGAGAGIDDGIVSVHPQNLTPDTLYYFRVVAKNALGTLDGPPQHTFRTQSVGGRFVLPDDRAWEMVSPIDKNGALILPLSGGVAEGGVVQAAEDGDALTYLTIESIVADPAGNSKESQVISSRGANGWETQDIASPHEDDKGVALGKGAEYWAFSPDLSLALVRPFGGTPPAPNLPGHDGDVYVRDNRSGTYTVLAETAGFNEEVFPVVSKWYSEQLSIAGGLPVGPYRAFMSDESLTGYDNLDVNSGEPDEEVFLENTTTKHLLCASCNPTEARPVGVFDRTTRENGEGLFVDGAQEWGEHWLAGSIPGPTLLDGNSDHVREPRFLNPVTGRLFFNSPDALVPRATNGKENVYEYEPESIGTCTSSTRSASEVFKVEGAEGGCISLISSGAGTTESEFLDASSDGDDVFFLTSAQLGTQDHDNSYDVYDAHVCDETAPCLAPAPVSPPACDTGDSCKPTTVLQPPIYGPPPSATFSGAGNPQGSELKPVPAPTKALTRAQKRAEALKACRKKPRKRRAACESRAKRKYGPAPKKSARVKRRAK